MVLAPVRIDMSVEEFCGCISFPVPEQTGFLSHNCSLEGRKAECLKLYKMTQGVFVGSQCHTVPRNLKSVKHLLGNLELEANVAYGTITPAL
jgi:hypothetical protein